VAARRELPLRFDDWFDRYDHWFMQLFWFAIIVTFVSETVYVVQTIRYGRDELSPGLSQRMHALRVLGVRRSESSPLTSRIEQPACLDLPA